MVLSDDKKRNFQCQLKTTDCVTQDQGRKFQTGIALYNKKYAVI